MSVSREIIKSARQALIAEGMDIRAWAKLISMMARGYRPVLDHDIEQKTIQDRAKSCGKRQDRYRLAFVKLADGTEVVRVDPMSQRKALEIVAEIHGLIQRGGTVNINTGANGHAGNLTVDDVGQLVVLMDTAPNQHLIDAIRALPPAERRKLAAAGALQMEAAATVREINDAET